MTYTLISQSKRDAGAILGHLKTWDGVVHDAWLPWMRGKTVKEVIAWCQRYKIAWRVEL